MVKSISDIATLYLPIPSIKQGNGPSHPSFALTLCSRQRPIQQKANLLRTSFLEATPPKIECIQASKHHKNPHNIGSNSKQASTAEHTLYPFKEVPETPFFGTENQATKKLLLATKPLKLNDDSIAIDVTALNADLVTNDVKLSPKSTSKKELKEGDRQISIENPLFTFDIVIPLAFTPKPSLFSLASTTIPQFTNSLQCPPDLPLIGVGKFGNSSAPPFHMEKRKLKVRKVAANKAILLCTAIIPDELGASRFLLEVPSVITLRFCIQKADFGDIGAAQFPKCEERKDLFANRLNEASHSCGDMLLRTYKSTAYVPSCLLFQPMKVPAVSHAKTRSFDLLQSSKIELLEENNDHQLFSIFLEPYWNSDRMFLLKKRILNEVFPPIVRRKAAKPSFLSLLRLTPLQRRVELEETSGPLALTEDIPVPKVADTKFSVDNSLSEFMMIRGKGAGNVTAAASKRQSFVTTPPRRKKVAEEKSFFDIGCVLNLPERFPLFPVVSRFLERYRQGSVLWVLSEESDPYERLLCSLFHKNEFATATVNNLGSIIAKGSLRQFALVIISLSEIGNARERKEPGKLLQALACKSPAKANFLVLCDNGPCELYENVEFLEKTLRISYVMGNNSAEALDGILHQEVVHTKVPSSVAKEIMPLLGSPEHAHFVRALALQDFEAALGLAATGFPSLMRNVGILKLESEAGLFANEIPDVFASKLLPAIWNTLKLTKDKIVIIARNNTEIKFIANRIQNDKVVVLDDISELPEKGVLENVRCVFRFLFDCDEDYGSADRALNEYLFYNLIYTREDPEQARFFALKITLDGYVRRPTVIDWWKAQDPQKIIYTSSLPEKSAFFFPLAQVKRVSPGRSLLSADEKKDVKRPRKVILSMSRAAALRYGEMFVDTDEHVFVKRFACTDSVNCCFMQTGFFSGVVVAFSKDCEQEIVECVNEAVANNSLKEVIVVAWYEFELCRKCGRESRVLRFKDEESFRLAISSALDIQLSKTPGENSWILDDETPYEKFLTNLGLNSFVAQFLLASLSLGKILTLDPAELCRKVGSNFPLDLEFFKLVRRVYERDLPKTPRKGVVYAAKSPLKSTPSKRTRVLYELPKGNVLGQTKLKTLPYDDSIDDNYRDDSTFCGSPKRKTPKLTAVSSPVKNEFKCRKKEICDFISNMYTYKGDDCDNKGNMIDGKVQVGFRKGVSSPNKASNPSFTSKNVRLTFPKLSAMKRFPQLSSLKK